MRLAVLAGLLLSWSQLLPGEPQAWPPGQLTPQSLVCVSSAVVYGPTAYMTVDFPAGPQYFWGALIARDSSGVGRRTVTFTNGRANLNPLGAKLRRNGWEGGPIPVTELLGSAPSWRYVFGYTQPRADECIASHAIQPEDLGVRDYAITAPATASIERVEISRIDTTTGVEHICRTWRRNELIPATEECGGGDGAVTFKIQSYSEPLNPPITEGVTRVPLIFLEAAQGFRFGCSGISADTACRLEIRWKPK